MADRCPTCGSEDCSVRCLASVTADFDVCLDPWHASPSPLAAAVALIKNLDRLVETTEDERDAWKARAEKAERERDEAKALLLEMRDMFLRGPAFVTLKARIDAVIERVDATRDSKESP